MVSLRPTRPGDIEAVYGQPLPFTISGITAEEDGRVVGVGAIYPTDGCFALICCISDSIRPLMRRHAKALLQGGKQLLAEAAKSPLPVRVAADRRHRGAIALIKHLGFRHVDKDTYEWLTPQ